MMIEPDIAALAAKRASEEDIEKIRLACVAVEEKIYQGKEFVTEDIDMMSLSASHPAVFVVLTSESTMVQTLSPPIRA